MNSDDFRTRHLLSDTIIDMRGKAWHDVLEQLEQYAQLDCGCFTAFESCLIEFHPFFTLELRTKDTILYSQLHKSYEECNILLGSLP